MNPGDRGSSAFPVVAAGGVEVKWAWISPVLWLAMASLLWMRAMISVREWALPMPRWRSSGWRRVGLLRRARRHAC